MVEGCGTLATIKATILALDEGRSAGQLGGAATVPPSCVLLQGAPLNGDESQKGGAHDHVPVVEGEWAHLEADPERAPPRCAEVGGDGEGGGVADVAEAGSVAGQRQKGHPVLRALQPGLLPKQAMRRRPSRLLSRPPSNQVRVDVGPLMKQEPEAPCMCPSTHAQYDASMPGSRRPYQGHRQCSKAVLLAPALRRGLPVVGVAAANRTRFTWPTIGCKGLPAMNSQWIRSVALHSFDSSFPSFRRRTQ